MIKWFNIKFGYRYCYQVRYTYMVNNNERFHFERIIGLSSKSTIIDFRKCKKIQLPLHKVESVKRELNNGSFNMVVVSYLGYFKTN